VRPRKVRLGNAFTWRFKTKDYWEAIPAPRTIETAEELIRLHEPWATARASEVLRIIGAHGGTLSLDEEGLIVVEIDDSRLADLNLELARAGCVVSQDLLHEV
jgi:hypothetical protein